MAVWNTCSMQYLKKCNNQLIILNWGHLDFTFWYMIEVSKKMQQWLMASLMKWFDKLFIIWIIIFLSLYSLLTIVTYDLTYLIFYCDTGVGNIRQLLFNNCSKYDILDKCQHWVVSVKIGTRADDITLWDEFDKLF